MRQAEYCQQLNNVALPLAIRRTMTTRTMRGEVMPGFLLFLVIVVGTLIGVAEVKSPFSSESMETRVLLSADFVGAVQATQLHEPAVSPQPAAITVASPTSTATSSTLAANTASSPALTPTMYVAPTRSNSNDGRTINTPFRTISQAGAVARAGDVVSIRGGTYSEYAVLQNSGTSASRITFMAHPGERVVVDGSSKSPNPSDP
jgi:hypothetical protein